eukprot:9143243-Heterocapsa_arctica.AAC.1
MSKAGCRACNCEQGPIIGAGSRNMDTGRALRLRQLPRSLPVAIRDTVQGTLLASLCSTGSVAHWTLPGRAWWPAPRVVAATDANAAWKMS